jgi:hypothetical protein
VYSVFIAYFLWLISGFGALGLHRFYLGKFGTGLLYLLTGGLAGIGGIYDFFTLPMQVRERNIERRYRHALSHGPVPNLDAPRDGVPREGPPPRTVGRSGTRDSIERVILRTAKANQGIATPSEVALEAEISLEDAKKQLEQLVSKGFAEVRVSRSGKLVYVFPDFSTDDTESKLEDF